MIYRSILLISFLIFGCTEKKEIITTKTLESPTNALLQAISIVDNDNIWISGHKGSFVRTRDAGKSWELFQHPTGDTLQFRDIHGFSESKALLMSAGEGPLSRMFLFETPNNWTETFVMRDSLGFLDCLDFWNDQRGIAYGDAIDSYPYILLTADGGQNWSRADTTNMPKAGKGEGGFASSGTCVTVGKNGRAWIATGAGGNARFLITEDFGASWTSVSSPLVKGDAAGNTSVSFEGSIGVVTGGDLLKPSEYTENCAFSLDGGLSWKLASEPKTAGAFYGTTLTSLEEDYYAFVCGPNGIDYTADLGQSWQNLDTLNYWAIELKDEIGYACGRDGKILKISLY